MFFFRKKYSSLADESLMQLLQQGDIQAFSEIYLRYSQRMLSYFYRMLAQDEQKAQDFLHDLFLKLLEKPALYDAEKKFSSWLYSVAYNLCKNEYRRLAIRKQYADEEKYLEQIHRLFTDDQVENQLDGDKFQKALLRELDGFDPDHQLIFFLRFQENFSIREIADILDCKEGTVRSRLFYLTRKLAVSLNEYNPLKYEVRNNEENK
jgi:RNA polymerase sigma-70 factor (ECF subfamily)